MSTVRNASNDTHEVAKEIRSHPIKEIWFAFFPESWCHGEWTLIDRIFSDMSVSVIFPLQLIKFHIIGI